MLTPEFDSNFRRSSNQFGQIFSRQGYTEFIYVFYRQTTWITLAINRLRPKAVRLWPKSPHQPPVQQCWRPHQSPRPAQRGHSNPCSSRVLCLEGPRPSWPHHTPAWYCLETQCLPNSPQWLSPRSVYDGISYWKMINCTRKIERVCNKVDLALCTKFGYTVPLIFGYYAHLCIRHR